MARLGRNLESVKVQNRQTILRLLNNSGAMSRKDIAHAVNLTSAAVTQLFSEMIEEGIIEEKGEVSEVGRVGRRKILVDIAYDCRIICSITIEKYMTWITLANLKGEIVETIAIATKSKIPPKEFLLKITNECKQCIEHNQIPQERLLGIGISLRGVVDKEQGISYKAYGIWNEEVPVRDIVESDMNVKVIVENNMKAFAQGEIIFGVGKQYEKLLFLKWYPGVGSAIVIDGKVYHSDSKKVPEIGHCMIDENGILCRCGKRGCLETVASISALTKKITSIYSEEYTQFLYEQTNGETERIHQVVLSNLTGNNGAVDESVMDVILSACSKIAKTIANAVTILGPDKVVVYGDLFENEEIYRTFVESSRRYYNFFHEDDIVKSDLCSKFFYIGGTAMVVNELFYHVGGYE